MFDQELINQIEREANEFLQPTIALWLAKGQVSLLEPHRLAVIGIDFYSPADGGTPETWFDIDVGEFDYDASESTPYDVLIAAGLTDKVHWPNDSLVKAHVVGFATEAQNDLIGAVAARFVGMAFTSRDNYLREGLIAGIQELASGAFQTFLETLGDTSNLAIRASINFEFDDRDASFDATHGSGELDRGNASLMNGNGDLYSATILVSGMSTAQNDMIAGMFFQLTSYAAAELFTH